MNRRNFLLLSGAGVVSGYSSHLSSGPSLQKTGITVTKGQTHIVGPDFPATDVWGFGGQVPGTPIRCKIQICAT